MEKFELKNIVVDILNTYRDNVQISLQKWNSWDDLINLRDKLHSILEDYGLRIPEECMTDDYINNLSFWTQDKTFLQIQQIERQLEDIFTTSTDKSLNDIYAEKEEYINWLPKDQQQKYNDLKTDALLYVLLWWSYSRQSSWIVHHIIDENQLADDMIEQRENEQTYRIENFLWEWREAHINALYNHTLAKVHKSLRPRIAELWLKEAYNFDEIEYIIDTYLYQWRKVYRIIRKNPEQVSEEDMKAFENLKTDPIFWLLSWGTGGKWRENHIFDDEKLAWILVNLINPDPTRISWR